MQRSKLLFSAFFISTLLMAGTAAAQAETVEAEVFEATSEGDGASVGTVFFIDSPEGLQIRTNLRGLPPGEHGFHVHENPDCSPTRAADGQVTPAGGAGGHYDPLKTGKHLGPNGGGHRGDLPRLVVGADGTAMGTMDARLVNVKASEFKNRAVMIHAGGDNYSDQPVTLGGGGARLACGVTK